MRLVLNVATALILPGLMPVQVTSTSPPLPTPTPTTVTSFPDLQKYRNLSDSQVSALVAIQQQQQQTVAQVPQQLSQKEQARLRATAPDALSIGQTMIAIQQTPDSN